MDPYHRGFSPMEEMRNELKKGNKKPPGKRYFTLDAPRDQPGQPFGCLLETTEYGLIVRGFVNQDTTIVALWNQRCNATFPADALKEGDVLENVNDIEIDCGFGAMSMLHELKTAAELFVLVRRDG